MLKDVLDLTRDIVNGAFGLMFCCCLALYTLFLLAVSPFWLTFQFLYDCVIKIQKKVFRKQQQGYEPMKNSYLYQETNFEKVTDTNSNAQEHD